MEKKEITLCGKQVTLAYCFGTEISYNILSEEEIRDFVLQCVKDINKERSPDTRKGIYLILAAMQAYYDSIGEDSPLTDKDLMFHMTAEEEGTAIGTIIGLWANFYKTPKGSKTEDDEKDTDDPKNG